MSTETRTDRQAVPDHPDHDPDADGECGCEDCRYDAWLDHMIDTHDRQAQEDRR